MIRLILFLSIVCVLASCAQRDAKRVAGVAPAKVEKLPLETEIGRITLTPDAERRLGIATAPITEASVERRRTFGGDIMIPVGKSIVVSAPFAGTITLADGKPLPIPGQPLEAGRPVLTLAPMLTPERDVPTPAEQVQLANARANLLAAAAVAQGDIERSRAEVEAAHVALERAEKLFADRAGPERDVDDARARLQIAESVLKAATDRADQLSRLIQELDRPNSQRSATPLVLTSPQAGILRSLSVAEGHAVTAGSALFEVVDIRQVWIRVPVFVELLAEIDATASALVVPLGAPHQQDAAGLVAAPVAAPPTADPLSASADLYYACENPNGALRPGQRVGAQLKMQGAEQGLTVPSKAILYDIYGGTWVYVRVGEHSFQRERVSIRFVDNARAVLGEGPHAGTVVVTDGAAELFGTEFGASK